MPASLSAADLAVVVPTRDRWPILRRTLAGLAGQTASGFVVVVVVDGRDQQVPADLGAARVLVVDRGGPGAARNAGVAAAERPLVLFLGDDMVPQPTLVAEHLAGHARDPAPELAVLGNVAWHPEVARDPLARWLDYSDLQFDFRHIVGEDAGWGRFYSCNVSLRAELFDRAGGFDPEFSYYYEDLDLAWRLRDAGLRLRFAPHALAHHLHRYDWAALERRFAGIARGEHLMGVKHPGFEPYFASRIRHAAGAPYTRMRWERLVPLAPPGRGRRAVQRRATRRYLQRLAPVFLDAWDGERDLAELRGYLGGRFDPRLLAGHVAAVETEERAAPDERSFYRTSEAYLYDLTVFAMSGTKLPYRQALQRAVPPGARLLDYGCGIGSDGLRLLEAGYRVDFADFANPSTAYLRWRLARRGLAAAVYDVEAEVPGGYDAAYSFDVIEHVPDPFRFLAELERRAAVVAVNFLEPDPADTHLHRPLPVEQLLAHARRCGLLHCRRYHGRSHLVVYTSPRSRS